MKTLELIGENYLGQSRLEEIGNRFYEGITELYGNLVEGLERIYNGMMAYGREDGSRKGQGMKDSGRRNINKNSCNGSGPGYGQGGGRGNGRGRGQN